MVMPITPVGTLVGYVAIEDPSTTYDPDGIYKCKVAFTKDAAKAMKEIIDTNMDKSFKDGSNKKKADPPYIVEDKKLIVTFKQKAKITLRSGKTKDIDIPIYDMDGEVISHELHMGEGSQIIVAYKPYLWETPQYGAGCTMQLNMVQVVKVVEYAGGDDDNGNPFANDTPAAEKDKNPFEQTIDSQNEVQIDDDGDF